MGAIHAGYQINEEGTPIKSEEGEYDLMIGSQGRVRNTIYKTVRYIVGILPPSQFVLGNVHIDEQTQESCLIDFRMFITRQDRAYLKKRGRRNRYQWLDVEDVLKLMRSSRQ